MVKSTTERALATNRRARYDYAIGETFEAGIALLGSENKSAREGLLKVMFTLKMVRHGLRTPTYPTTHQQGFMASTNLPGHENYC